MTPKSACATTTGNGLSDGLHAFKARDSFCMFKTAYTPCTNVGPDAAVTDKSLWVPMGTAGRKGTFARTDAVPLTIKDHKLVKTMLIHASRRIIINRDGEEVTGMSRLGRGHWATDICYN